MLPDQKSLVAELLACSVDAYRTFAPLQELSEDLRVLSLNAELAAARSGDGGRVIRSLTSYTRRLVEDLKETERSLSLLKAEAYAAGACALQAFHRLRLLEEAGKGARAEPAIQRGRQNAVDKVHVVLVTVRRLEECAFTIKRITKQSITIATNIAIESSHGGPNEREFKVVAETMKAYAKRLADMTTIAEKSVGAAVSADIALSTRLQPASTHLSRRAA